MVYLVTMWNIIYWRKSIRGVVANALDSGIVVVFHLLKSMLTYAQERHELLLIGYRPYEYLISDKILLPSCSHAVLLYGGTTYILTKRLGES